MILDCAAFESALAEALAESAGAAPAVVAALRAHAEGCPACRHSLPLVALAATPAAERDPLPEPTDLDWARFDRRLKARLDAESSLGWSWGFAAVAATVAGALLGAWLLREPEGALIAEGPKPTPPPAKVEAPKPAPAPPATEEPEIEPLRPDPWAARGLPENDADAPLDGPFPDLDRLDPEARERLLRWLDEEEARLSPRGDA
jgi:hypothetical protein